MSDIGCPVFTLILGFDFIFGYLQQFVECIDWFISKLGRFISSNSNYPRLQQVIEVFGKWFVVSAGINHASIHAVASSNFVERIIGSLNFARLTVVFHISFLGTGNIQIVGSGYYSVSMVHYAEPHICSMSGDSFVFIFAHITPLPHYDSKFVSSQ